MKPLVTSTLVAIVALSVSAAATEKIVWKPVVAAVLKVDGRPAKIWNAYVAQKKEHLVLVQLGSRFLMLDTELREVVEIASARLGRRGKELHWQRIAPEAQRHKQGQESDAETQSTQRNAEKPAGGTKAEKVLASEEWNIRDAGRARIIHVKLTTEGRVLEVQLPLQPDQRFY